MKKLILVILLNILLYASVGEITALVGKAEILRDNKKLNAAVGFKLEKKDVIKTFDTTKMQIIFNDESIITIGKNSTFKIEDYVFDENKPKATFNLSNGIIKTLTGKIGKLAPQRFKVKTKNAVIGIRGTYFVVEFKNNITMVGMLGGKVNFVDKISNKTYTISKGQMIILNPNLPKEKRVIVKNGFKEPDAVKIGAKKKKDTQKTQKEQKKRTNTSKNNEKNKKTQNNKNIKNKENKNSQKIQTKKDKLQTNKNTQKTTSQESKTTQNKNEPAQQTSQKTNEQTKLSQHQSQEESQPSEQSQQTQQSENKPQTDIAQSQQTQQPQNEPQTDEQTQADTQTDKIQANEPQIVETSQDSEAIQQPETSQITTENLNNEAPVQETNDIDEPVINEEIEYGVDETTDNTEITETVDVVENTNENVNTITTDETVDESTDNIVSNQNENNENTSNVDNNEEDTTTNNNNNEEDTTTNNNDNEEDTTTNNNNNEEETTTNNNDNEEETTTNNNDNEEETSDNENENSEVTIDEIMPPNVPDIDYPPILQAEITTQPAEELQELGIEGYFSSSPIQISGYVNEDAVINIYINDQLLSTFSANGNWSKNIILPEGENNIKIEAVDSSDKTSQILIESIIAVSEDDYNQAVNNADVSDNPQNNGNINLPTEENLNKDIVYSDNYLSYGYWVDDNNQKIDTWIEGVITPNENIEDNIQNQVSAVYSGNVIAITDEGSANGNINLNIDFGNLNINGNMNFATQNGTKWDINIQNGEVTPYGFSSQSLTTGTNSDVENISGKLEGKFYGNNAEVVGGSFEVNGDNHNAQGVFGAKK